jgi:FkbM family methyltransferase
MTNTRIVSRPPILLRAAKKITRSGMRGGGLLTRTLLRLGMLNQIAQYQLGPVSYRVPLFRIPWDYLDVVSYEAQLVDLFCRALKPLRDVVLFDCGADIGTFSSLVFSKTRAVSRIIAFEPNRDTHAHLRYNLSNLGVPVEIIPKAISSFEGWGHLQNPPENLTDHARFLVPGEGSVEITTIDSLNVRGGDVAIKTDLEGGELEALKGAAETIAAAGDCVVTVEAHPDVAKRTGFDPVVCLRFLESVRPFRFIVAETGQPASTELPILRPGQTQIWNVVGWTHDASA